jgi:uncharacterized protein involved in outer membrane biogenesis
VKKYKKIILGAVFIIGVLLIVPFFIPVETYLRQAEAVASEALGVPVQIKDANIALLPTPRVHGSGLVVGKNTDLSVDDIVIIPTLASLFSKQKVIVVELNEVVMKKTALASFDALMKPNKDDAPSTVAISSLSINQLQLDWPGVSLPLIKLTMDLEDNTMVSANIAAIDGSIAALVTPEKVGQQIMVNLKQFKLPTKTPLVVNSGEFTMLLQGSQLDIPKFSLALYDGTITGHSQLSWAKAAKLTGEFTVNAISLKEPSYQANPQTYMTGYLSGNGKLFSQANAIDQLADHLQLQLPFTIKDGVLHGLDLVKAASLVVKQDTGGQTKFDTFSGHLAVAGGSYKLTNLQVDSGLLSATGDVVISAKGTLKGDVNVALKKSAGLAEVPLVVSGTLDNPSVSPSKLALLGAAAGTAVLGPGVGTSLGIKASKGISKIKSLFGGDDE